MRMKIHVVKNDTNIKRNPIDVSNNRFRRCFPECVCSIMMKPRPPRINRKALASPSMMYCPFTRYGMKATGREWPCASVVDPTLGGSMITSYMIPGSNKKVNQCNCGNRGGLPYLQ